MGRECNFPRHTGKFKRSTPFSGLSFPYPGPFAPGFSDGPDANALCAQPDRMCPFTPKVETANDPRRSPAAKPAERLQCHHHIGKGAIFKGGTGVTNQTDDMTGAAINARRCVTREGAGSLMGRDRPGRRGILSCRRGAARSHAQSAVAFHRRK